MSIHKVPYTKVLAVDNHPNADRLELLTIYGFQVVATKGRYKVNDYVIFIPIDSVLPQWLEDKLFPPEDNKKPGKIQRSGDRRIRQIRIRKFPSHGMVLNPEDVADRLGTDKFRKLGSYDEDQDLSEDLEITKYEPPFKDRGSQGEKKRNKPLENSRFHQYKGVENLRWFPNLFQEGEEVVVQCKLHGSNLRVGIQPSEANTIWKKVKKLFGFLPEFERVYGSNMVQLQNRPGHTGYYGSDVYGAVLQKINAFDKIKPGETLFLELIGPGIQKGYTYGHSEHHAVLFDVKKTLEDGRQEYLNPDDAEAYAKERGFDFVPILYRGPFNKAKIEEMSTGPSVYCPKEKVREGVVIKAKTNYGENGSKKALKVINPEYLDNHNNTDNH